MLRLGKTLGFSNGPGVVKLLPIQGTPGSTRVDDHCIMLSAQH